MKSWLIGLWLVVSSWPVFGQSLIREQLTGTWIGVHYAWDSDFFVPISNYLRFDADSNYTIGALNDRESLIQKRWSITDGAVRMDTNQFRAGAVRVVGDLLQIDGYFPLIFRRFRDVPLSIDSVRRILANRIWHVGTTRLHLHDTGLACREDSVHPGDRTVHRWSVVRHEQSVFLLIKGVQDDSVGNYQPPLQLMKTGKNDVQAVGWDGTAVATQTLRASAVRLTPGQGCEPVGFQPCVTYLYRPLTMYYSFGQRGHSERLYFIRTTVGRLYKPVLLPGQSGLVRVRFQVNCRGEAGRFELLELDENYQQRPFDRRITGQVLTICRQSLATGWLPGKRSRDDTPTDYFQFITFRLHNGVITEIFP